MGVKVLTTVKDRIEGIQEQRVTIYTVLCSIFLCVLGIYATYYFATGVSIRVEVDSHPLNLLYLVPLLVLGVMYYNRYRKARYQTSILYIHHVNEAVRNYVELKNPKSDDAYKAVQDIINAVADAFSMVTRCRCSASLKLYDPAEQGTVEYVVFDRYVSEEIKKLRNVSFKCTEFSSMSAFLADKEGRNLYHCPNVCAEYKESKYHHPKLAENPPKNFRLRTKTYKDWPLGFESTLVLPIRYPNYSLVESPPSIEAFLCVDSVNKNAFKLKYDIDLGGAFADILHIVVRDLR